MVSICVARVIVRVYLARRRGTTRSWLMATAAAVLIAAIACGGKGGPGRREADAALLTPNDVGVGWSATRPPLIDNDSSGPKGFFAVCPYEASSEPREFARIVREEPLAYFSQGVFAMDAGDVERCVALVAADFATRNELADPGLVPTPCPKTSLILVTTDADVGARHISWAIIPGQKGLISSLNLEGMSQDDPWPAIIASACVRLAEAEAQIGG
jgi:hypothetical protein